MTAPYKSIIDTDIYYYYCCSFSSCCVIKMYRFDDANCCRALYTATVINTPETVMQTELSDSGLICKENRQLLLDGDY